MTSEELDLYFSSASGGQNDIWVARRTLTSDPWGSGALVAELSSPQNDEDPEVSVDGLNMFLSSDRGGDGMHLYVARRRTHDTPWEQPVRVDGLGSSTRDLAPAVDVRTQLYLVFASQRGAASDLHLFAAMRPDASAAWQFAGELTALSSTSRDTDPALFAEGRTLIFASLRTAPSGKTDLISNLALQRQLAVRLARRPDRRPQHERLGRGSVGLAGWPPHPVRVRPRRSQPHIRSLALSACCAQIRTARRPGAQLQVEAGEGRIRRARNQPSAPCIARRAEAPPLRRRR